MAKRIRDLYDKPVYSTEAEYLGVVDDFIFDTVEGKITELVVITRQKTTIKIPYRNVVKCKDIYLVQYEEAIPMRL